MGDYFNNLPKFVSEFLESKKELDAIPFIYSVRKDKTLEQFERNKIISAFIINKMKSDGHFQKSGHELSWMVRDEDAEINGTFVISTNVLELKGYIMVHYGLNPTEPEYEYLINEIQAYLLYMKSSSGKINLRFAG